ncbi:MAG: hypothetical protein MJ069_07565 [Salinivirgaceae bacterium]|nr:hypothetical protein [Salinivirgaceae bacterium]
MNKLIYISTIYLLLTLTSCTQQNTQGIVLAESSGKALYLNDVDIPEQLSGNDSILYIQNYVDNWIHRQVVLEKAEENIDKQSLHAMDKMVDDYRRSLMVYKYYQMYITQKLDTFILDSEITNHYNRYGNNFILNNNAIRAIFVQVPKSLPDGDKLRQLIRSDREKDMIELEEICYKSARTFNAGNNWEYADESIKQLPEGTITNTEKFLQSSKKYVEAQDSIYNYLYRIIEVRFIGEQSPLELSRNKVKEIILNHRKNKLIKELDNQIYIDAVNKNKFTNYVK